MFFHCVIHNIEYSRGSRGRWGFRWGLVLALQVLQSHMVTQKQGHAGVYILLQKNNANCNFSLADKRVETNMQGGKQ